MEQQNGQRRNAAVKGAQIESSKSKEECAWHGAEPNKRKLCRTEGCITNIAVKDEECAPSMEQSVNDAAAKGAHKLLCLEECVCV